MTPDHTTVATLVTDLATAGPRLHEPGQLERFFAKAAALARELDSPVHPTPEWTRADVDAVRAIVAAPVGATS